jgi:hypothetical protein
MESGGSAVTRVLLCHKARVLRGEMSVVHAKLIPVHNPQANALSIPAVTYESFGWLKAKM